MSSPTEEDISILKPAPGSRGYIVQEPPRDFNSSSEDGTSFGGSSPNDDHSNEEGGDENIKETLVQV
jgi:hypothetical protein